MVLMFSFFIFLCLATVLPFFHFEENIQVSKQFSAEGLLNSPHIFSVQVLILSRTWILFGSSYLINLEISLIV